MSRYGHEYALGGYDSVRSPATITIDLGGCDLRNINANSFYDLKEIDFYGNVENILTLKKPKVAQDQKTILTDVEGTVRLFSNIKEPSCVSIQVAYGRLHGCPWELLACAIHAPDHLKRLAHEHDIATQWRIESNYYRLIFGRFYNGYSRYLGGYEFKLFQSNVDWLGTDLNLSRELRFYGI